MYLYGYKEATMLTKKMKKWLEIVVDTYDKLGYSAGRGLLTFGTYTIRIESLKEDISSIMENLYGDYKTIPMCQDILRDMDFTQEDLDSLTTFVQKVENSFFTTFMNKTAMEDENIFAEYRVIKRNGKYQQMVMVLPRCKNYFSILLFDDELEFIERIDTTIGEHKTIIEYVNNNFDVAKGITMDVLTSGISSKTKSAKLGRVFVVDETGTVIPEGVCATTLSQTYVIKYHDKVMGMYIAKPMKDPKKWYMNSGNFIATSNSMFDFNYAIPVFDRVEE